jgi:hypothetical protein
LFGRGSEPPNLLFERWARRSENDPLAARKVIHLEA